METTPAKWTQEEMDTLFTLVEAHAYKRESDAKICVHWGNVADAFGDSRTAAALRSHFRFEHPEGPHLKSKR